MEKALLFPNWSSFSRQTPSPYVLNFRGFFLYLGGKDWREARKEGHGVPVQDGCRVGLGPHRPASWANRRVGPRDTGLGCGLLTTRPGRYGKERRAGRQEAARQVGTGGRVGYIEIDTIE